ncbi:MAG: hypothetical protein PHO03_00700 [Candidatus Omnitrophica bacterium]|nr:hypothetical protein [Candidatus Omnitrophota bacterium]
MKKARVIFFILSLLILGAVFSCAFAADAAEQGPLAQDFSQKAMDEFKTINDTQLDYAAVSSKVDDYAQKFAGILLDAGLDAKTAAMIMQQAAVWYGKALKDLFNGNPYNSIIQDYSAKIADLFSQQHLKLDTQSKIVDMGSDNLESLNTLFQRVEGRGDVDY